MYVRTNRKHSYARSTEQELRVHLVPFFRDADLRAITPELVARYKAVKAKELAPKTVNNHIGVLSMLFRKAVEWGYCERNPVTGTGLLSLPPQEFRFWDREQSDAFLAAVEVTDPGWYAFFLCALRTGMRLGELCALRQEDLDFVKRQVHVVWNYTHGKLGTPKSGHGRLLPMSPRLSEVLRSRRHLRGSLVFCKPDGGFLTRDMVKHPFDRATRKAGLPSIRIHDLRHSFASQLVMAGVPLTAVKEYLGHADLKMTMRYAHLSPAAREQYVGVLDGIELGDPAVTERSRRS
ncbi:MAG: tyrosine-type recombinase/integrase [Patescibacteria group bacterium]